MLKLNVLSFRNYFDTIYPNENVYPFLVNYIMVELFGQNYRRYEFTVKVG